MRVGVAVVDITPPAGLSMAGFGVRTEPAVGCHDALTARAIAIDSFAIICVDVLALDRATTARIRERCCLPSEHVIVTALHTHGGPETLASRRHPGLNASILAGMETACVRAINEAVASQRAATMRAGIGGDPKVAKNRRHPGGITDSTLPVLQFSDVDGRIVATVLSYACHPVVLGADNRLWTADYPGSVRRKLEEHWPGSVAIFLTGCAGDANTGHAAHASNTLSTNNLRTFEQADLLAEAIATCVAKAPLGETSGGVAVASEDVRLGFERRERGSLHELLHAWREEMEVAAPLQRTMLLSWIEWAERMLSVAIESLTILARVTVLRVGEVEIVALPGEIFAETARTIRERIGSDCAFIIGYADDDPGYIAPSSEYPFGGYEIDEAHRYYGMPATFARGAAELLADVAVDLVLQLRSRISMP